LKCVPQTDAKVLIFNTCEYDFIWHRVFVEAQVKVRSLEWPLNQYNSVLIKRGNLDTNANTQRTQCEIYSSPIYKTRSIWGSEKLGEWPGADSFPQTSEGT
jgi:hypothetical protein